MKRSYLFWAATAAFTVAAAGCSDDGVSVTVESAGADSKGPGGNANLVVAVTTSDAVAATMSHVELTVSGPATAASTATETTGTADATDTTPAAVPLPDGTAFTLSDLSEPLVLSGLGPGTLTLTARAFAEGASAPVAEAEATVEVTTSATGTAVLNLAAAVADVLSVESLTASDNSPRNHDKVKLSVDVAAATAGDVTYTWSDDCGGNFNNANAAAPTWTNYTVQDCTIRVTAEQNGLTTSGSVDVAMSLRPGTVEYVAGTTCANHGGAGWYGVGSVPLKGEDGPALEASFSEIYGLDMGPDGNLYMADRAGGRILMLDTDAGTIHRVVGIAGGSGADGDSGDGGPVTAAVIDWAFDVAITETGGMWIASAFGDRIRRVYANGMTIDTVFGGTNGVPADGEKGTDAEPEMPTGVAVAPNGLVYVVSNDHERLYRLYPDTLTVETVATDVDSEYVNAAMDQYWEEGGFDVEVDSQNRPIVVERYEQRITRFDPETGDQTVMIGTTAHGDTIDEGDALSTTLRSPMGLGIDADDRLFVADTFNNKVRLVETDGSARTIAGPGFSYVLGRPGPVNDAIVLPKDVEVDADGNVYVAEKESCQIKKIWGPF